MGGKVEDKGPRSLFSSLRTPHLGQAREQLDVRQAGRGRVCVAVQGKLARRCRVAVTAAVHADVRDVLHLQRGRRGQRRDVVAAGGLCRLHLSKPISLPQSCLHERREGVRVRAVLGGREGRVRRDDLRAGR